MLVLTRLRDQAIIIGHDIEVTVIDIRGDKARLGIRAPKEVSVHRKEIYDAIRKENRDASRLGGGATDGGAAPAPPGVATFPAPSAEDPFLRAAVEEALQGLKEGGLPIGSVLVRDGKVVAAGHNRRVQNGDPMAHAEIDCLTRAARQKTYRDTVLYSTLMPCYLCAGAVVQFGIPKVVVGESVNFPGGPEFMRKHGVEVIDLHDPLCIRVMGDFIKARPELWREDIGR